MKLVVKIALILAASLLLVAVLYSCAHFGSRGAGDQRSAVDAARNRAESLQAKPAAALASPATWHTIAQWSGNGIKETQTFLVQGSEWRISWKAMGETFAGAGVLQVYVYNAAGSLVTLAANHQGIGSDVSYMHTQPGRFYLQINANVDWEVVVEDQF